MGKKLIRRRLIRIYSMGMEKEERLIKYFSRRSIESVNPFEIGGKKRGNVYL